MMPEMVVVFNHLDTPIQTWIPLTVDGAYTELLYNAKLNFKEGQVGMEIPARTAYVLKLR